jgi:hypothetical protein
MNEDYDDRFMADDSHDYGDESVKMAGLVVGACLIGICAAVALVWWFS